MPKRLSQEEFLKSFKNVPRVAINLIVVDNQNRVLLTRRSIPPCVGKWHFPGSFLLKNEKLENAQKRIAKNEFGLTIKKYDSSLLGVFEDINSDPRGHVIDIVYGIKINNVNKIKTTKETMEAKFFEKLPEEIGFNHQETLNNLGFK